MSCKSCDRWIARKEMGVYEAIEKYGCPVIDNGSWTEYAFDDSRWCAFDPETNECIWHIDVETHEVVFDQCNFLYPNCVDLNNMELEVSSSNG